MSERFRENIWYNKNQPSTLVEVIDRLASAIISIKNPDDDLIFPNGIPIESEIQNIGGTDGGETRAK